MNDLVVSVLEPVIRLGLPLCASVLSLASFVVTMRNWRQGNRPIVAATLRTHESSNTVILYDLVVLNAGNRPATNICIAADLKEVATCLSELKLADKSNPLWKTVLQCLSKQNHIPLLVHGKETTNSFGYTAGANESFWKYRSSFLIKITYSDLNGKKYVSKQRLVIQDSEAFANGKWGKTG